MTADTTILEQPLFQFFTIFNSINSLADVVLGDYEQYAIPKIENATKDLADYGYVIPRLTNEDAEQQLLLITKIVKPFLSLRKKFEKEQRADLLQFKNAILDFFVQLDHIEKQLGKAAQQEDNVRAIFHHMTHNRKNPAIAKYLK